MATVTPTPPQALLDAVALLESDKAGISASAAQATADATAAAAAVHVADLSATAATASVAKQASDLAAAHALLDSLYGPAAMPAPVVAPPA